MTECRDCQRMNSDTAEVCPGCGLRFRMSFGAKLLIWLVVIFVGLPITCAGGTAMLAALGLASIRKDGPKAPSALDVCAKLEAAWLASNCREHPPGGLAFA